jgi:galactokinase
MNDTWLESWARTDGAHRAVTVFRTHFDAEPDGVWSAPGRVNLIGEHTDYNGGLCLPIDLPHRTYVALRRRDDDRVALASAQELEGWSGDLAQVRPGTGLGWASYVAGVAWAINAGRTSRSAPRVGGFDAAVTSCVPYGAGLSSSAALESAVAVALDDVNGLGLAVDDDGRARLVAACVRAENEIAGAPTGGLDQSASLRASAGHALLLDFRDGAIRHVPFDLTAVGLAMLVIDTRAEHQLADGQYAARRETCEAAAAQLGVATVRNLCDGDGLDAALARLAASDLPDADIAVRRVRHVVTEITRVQEFVALLDAGRLREVGPLMDASHASLRDDYEVSCAELDLAVSTARAHGALGARMTGGGFGGSAIALVEAGDVVEVAAAVSEAFAAAQFHAPAFLLAEASAPADRDR